MATKQKDIKLTKKVFEKPKKPNLGDKNKVEIIVMPGSMSLKKLREKINEISTDYDSLSVSLGGNYYGSTWPLRIEGQITISKELYDSRMREYEEKMAEYKKSLIAELNEVAAEEIL